MSNKENFEKRAIEMMRTFGRGDIAKAEAKAGRMWDNIFKEIGDGGGTEPPGPPPAFDRDALLQFDGMGFFLWWQLGWWDPDTRTQRYEEAQETLEYFAACGYDAIDFFAWLNTGTWDNAHFDHLCPYPREGGLFVLNRIRPKWLESLEALERLMKVIGIDPLCCDYMARYCWRPYDAGRNKNGVTGFFDPAALEFQTLLGTSINTVEESVFGDQFFNRRRPINEVTHNGYLPGVVVPPDRTPADYKLHVVHDWLQGYYEQALMPHVDVAGILHDVSGTEADPWVGEHDCPKCDTRKLGNNKFLDANGKRQHKRVVHTVTLVEDIPFSGYDRWLGSGWVWPPHVHYWGGDGGTRFKDLARGCKLRKPSGAVIWAQGDAEQTYDCSKQVFQDAKDHAGQREFRAGYQLVCLESLDGSWPMVEDFRLSRLDKARIAAPPQALKAVFGSDGG